MLKIDLTVVESQIGDFDGFAVAFTWSRGDSPLTAMALRGLLGRSNCIALRAVQISWYSCPSRDALTLSTGLDFLIGIGIRSCCFCIANGFAAAQLSPRRDSIWPYLLPDPQAARVEL